MTRYAEPIWLSCIPCLFKIYTFFDFRMAISIRNINERQIITPDIIRVGMKFACGGASSVDIILPVVKSNVITVFSTVVMR